MPRAKGKAPESNILYLVAYLVPVLSGLVVYYYAKKDKAIAFHGVQSVVFWIAIIMIYFILEIAFVETRAFGAITLLTLFLVLAWLYGLYVGYRAVIGNPIEMPVISALVTSFGRGPRVAK